jgi:hypothetical protein
MVVQSQSKRKGCTKEEADGRRYGFVQLPRQKLTFCNRIEEVQGKEKVNTTACMMRKRCMDYCITVEIPEFGERYERARSFKCVLDMLKIIVQIAAKEYNALIHQMDSHSMLNQE